MSEPRTRLTSDPVIAMRINENVAIKGNLVKLVPYCAKHVPKYHEWMQSQELQELTASEPLTLEQEYEMCRSWQEDEDKLTFILLDLGREDGDLGQMCGDVNLFLNDHDDRTRGELELMIAEPASRRKGIGMEALGLFMAYCAVEIGIRTFRVQIGEDNGPSIGLFKKLGFIEVGRSEFFKEVHLERCLEGSELDEMLDQSRSIEGEFYERNE